MTFEDWLKQLAIELSKAFSMSEADGVKYVQDTGADSWREMFEDGQTPAEAAAEEAQVAMESQ